MAKRKKDSNKGDAPVASAQDAVEAQDAVQAQEDLQAQEQAQEEVQAQPEVDAPEAVVPDEATEARETIPAEMQPEEPVELAEEVPDNVRDLFGADPVSADPEVTVVAETDADDELFEVQEGVVPLDGPRLVSALESLLFASDRLLSLADLRRLTSVRDTKKVQAALDELRESRKESGIILVEAAGSFRLKTNPANVEFVSRIIQGKPVRLGRAMMETLAIVAYKQPITRAEVDDVRGVDCGPVLRTLLDRNLIRVIGKKEDLGRPLLYGTTPEFLKTFNLSDLTELPTLREFHELGAEESAKMKKTFGDDAVSDGAGERASAEGPSAPANEGDATTGVDDATLRTDGLRGSRPSAFSNHTVADVPEDDSLIDELERATEAATRALEAGKSEPGQPVS